MKYFKTIQELLDYVPNCLVCGKQLQLLIEGSWGNGVDKNEFRSIKMSVKDGYLVSKHKKYNFCLDPKSNEIISGKMYCKTLADSHVFVYKTCHTCYCIFICSLANKNYKNWTIFPDLALDTEEVKYTMRGNKEVSIYKNHYGMYYQINPLVLERKMSISINRKREYYPNNYIDFDKIKNLSSLNKKISTIMVFQ